MARWTEDGWELLETIALNAALFTGFESSAHKVMEDALRACTLIESNPGIGKKILNIYNEKRYWHPFHEGKVLVWKLDSNGNPVFTGAFYSLPEYLTT
ncbi:MAG: hypothetical protein HYW49_04620 [Deltaproteobacteria bacterium]|nr:hypothetical protein [Deltaproteobacteria bacterium]